MDVIVKAHGHLMWYLPGCTADDQIVINISEDGGTSIVDLLNIMDIPEAQIARIQVNGRITSTNHRLREGEFVQLFPVICGG